MFWEKRGGRSLGGIVTSTCSPISPCHTWQLIQTFCLQKRLATSTSRIHSLKGVWLDGRVGIRAKRRGLFFLLFFFCSFSIVTIGARGLWCPANRSDSIFIPFGVRSEHKSLCIRTRRQRTLCNILCWPALDQCALFFINTYATFSSQKYVSHSIQYMQWQVPYNIAAR